MVQWLGLGTFTARAWVQSLVGELRSYKPQFSSVAQSCPTLCQHHGLQHARPPCPSPTPGACSNSCPSSRWCHPKKKRRNRPWSPNGLMVPFVLSLSLFSFCLLAGVRYFRWENKVSGYRWWLFYNFPKLNFRCYLFFFFFFKSRPYPWPVSPLIVI